jgi:hypothetical protein
MINLQEKFSFHVLFRFSWQEWILFSIVAAASFEYFTEWPFYSNYLLLSIPAIWISHHSSQLRNEVDDADRDSLRRLCIRRYRDLILYFTYGSLLIAYYAVTALIFLAACSLVLGAVAEPISAIGSGFLGGYFAGALFFGLLLVGLFLIFLAIALLFPRNLALSIFDGLIRVRNFLGRPFIFLLDRHERTVTIALKKITSLNRL